MARMKVLISGGGIAGNALAFWLSKIGHEVTVVERFPSLRATGLQLDLRGHGIEVMKRMGLEQAFRSKMAPEQGIQMVDKSGKRRAYFPANKTGKGVQSFTTDYEIMRGDLCQIMYDATKPRAHYVFGTSIESFEQTDSAVEVRFTDGKTDRFDLLVGADGLGSRTRRMMLGENTPDAFFPIAGQYIAYFTVPRPIQSGEEYIATSYLAPGRRGAMTRRNDPNHLMVYLGTTTDSARLANARRGDVDEEKKAMAEIFQGAGGLIDDILPSLKDADDFYCERMGLVKLDAWSRGRVALVGDAAYCPSANTGMGTTAGIVGAYMLAGEMAKHCGLGTEGLATALREYERRFRPFMEQVQEGVLESGGTRYPSSPLAIAVVNWVMGLAALLRVNVFGWFLKEAVRDWELPEYEEMRRD